jgi:hypothetical protein
MESCWRISSFASICPEASVHAFVSSACRFTQIVSEERRIRIDATTTSVQTAIARLRVSGGLSPRLGAGGAWAPLLMGAIIHYLRVRCHHPRWVTRESKVRSWCS